MAEGDGEYQHGRSHDGVVEARHHPARHREPDHHAGRDPQALTQLRETELAPPAPAPRADDTAPKVWIGASVPRSSLPELRW